MVHGVGCEGCSLQGAGSMVQSVKGVDCKGYTGYVV